MVVRLQKEVEEQFDSLLKEEEVVVLLHLLKFLEVPDSLLKEVVVVLLKKEYLF